MVVLRAWIRLYCASGLLSLWLVLLLLGWFDPPWVHLLLAAAIATLPWRAFARAPEGHRPGAPPEDLPKVDGAAAPGDAEA